MYSSSFENVGLVFVWSHIYSRKQNIDFAWHLAIVLIAHLQFMLSGLDHDILVKSRAFLSYFCDQPTEILKSRELKTRHFQKLAISKRSTFFVLSL